MKTLVSKATAFCLLFLICGISYAQSQTSNTTHEAVIGCPDVTEKQIDHIQQQLDQLPGIHVLGYEAEHQLILVKYDPSLYTDGPAVTQFIGTQFINQRFYYKPNRTREDVLSPADTGK